jgi:glycosyltransferase involved in cell wall biosynthesis
MNPKVSFIVPCYKLAHFLGDCMNSILVQTYGDFEVLIMDDCSPDDTPDVAAKFDDPRVRYIRNEANLGNIRNYNKGIELSRGRYIWLISADDRLRSQNVLQRYVELLDNNPQVGYVFCPAMILRNGEGIGVEGWTMWPGIRDRILSGHEVVSRSAICCPVCAPTALVRKECYTFTGGFPLNLPQAADYYLWVMFATKYDVGYFAEPMIYYRRHATNMDKILEIGQPSTYFEQELLVIWLIKKEAEKIGLHSSLSDFCRRLADMYLMRLVRKEVENWEHGRTWNDLMQEINAHASNKKDAEEILDHIRAAWPTALADGQTRAGAGYYTRGQLDHAVNAFQSALSSNPCDMKPRIYLCASRIEQLFGIRLVPWLKLLKNALH